VVQPCPIEIEQGDFVNMSLSRPTDSSKRQRRRRLLVVDDISINLDVASLMLEQMGYEVDRADGAEQAIERCLRHAPDAVLMDIEMPEVDGLEATRRLRLLQRAGHLSDFPIIALTAVASTDVEWREAGMSGFLPKPFNRAQVGDEIRHQLALQGLD
jgi:CheY-like chemotaxis protein